MSDKLPHPKPLDIAAAMAKGRPEIDYVLPGLPVGAAATLVGGGGIGKSFFVLQLAIAMATGQSWPDELLSAGEHHVARRKPSRTVLVLSEESQEMTLLRLHDIVDHLSDSKASRKALTALLAENLVIHALAGGPRLLLDGHVEGAYGLDTLSALCEGARLVILDPLRRFHAGEENSSLEMTQTVEACERVAHRRACAFVLTHHSNKLAGQTAAGEKSAASRGSSALTDGVRLQMNLSALDEPMAKRFQLEPGESARCVRFDIAKANYLADGPRGILKRTACGILVPASGLDLHGMEPASVPSRGRRSGVKSGRDVV